MSQAQPEAETDSYTCATCESNVADIVELVTHECDTILQAASLSQSERATLMYIESRIVDHSAELDHQQMNHEDQQNIKLFQAAGILTVEDFSVKQFTDEAWDLARDCRQMRANSWIESDVDIGDVPGETEE